LTRIVAMLITMVAGYDTLVPKPIYHAVLRVLYPAESAVRRLIVIAARGLKVTLSPSRPMPQGLVFTGERSGRMTFSLCDPRRELPSPYMRRPSGLPEPRIRVLDASPLVPLFQVQPAEPPVLPSETGISPQRLKRRLEAIKRALDTLPQQARRLARLQAKRATSEHPPQRPLLRSGSPPRFPHQTSRRDRLRPQGMPRPRPRCAPGRHVLISVQSDNENLPRPRPSRRALACPPQEEVMGRAVMDRAFMLRSARRARLEARRRAASPR
jgi:hypothetical protein